MINKGLLNKDFIQFHNKKYNTTLTDKNITVLLNITGHYFPFQKYNSFYK